jgi:hypothetical protein
MHIVGAFLFLSLVVMGVTMLGERLFHPHRELWALIAMAVGVVAALIGGVDVWPAWGLSIHTAWLGDVYTGLALGGGAVVLHAITLFFLSLDRKLEDQAQVMERHELRKVA